MAVGGVAVLLDPDRGRAVDDADDAAALASGRYQDLDLMGGSDRSMLDRYGADLQVQRAIEAKRRRGETY